VIIPLTVTEQVALLGFLRLMSVHDPEARVTEPVPYWDQSTVPVGRYPDTLALQITVIINDTEDVGLQETEIFAILIVTSMSYCPVVGELSESPL
jgi:hypothetical protein